MRTLAQIKQTPIWKLSRDEINLLPEVDQLWVLGRLHDMKEDGTLPMLLANPPDTKYEVVFDGKWILRPMKVDPDYEARLNAVEDCLRDICKTQTWYEAIQRSRYAKQETAAPPQEQR